MFAPTRIIGTTLNPLLAHVAAASALGRCQDQPQDDDMKDFVRTMLEPGSRVLCSRSVTVATLPFTEKKHRRAMKLTGSVLNITGLSMHACLEKFCIHIADEDGLLQYDEFSQYDEASMVAANKSQPQKAKVLLVDERSNTEPDKPDNAAALALVNPFSFSVQLKGYSAVTKIMQIHLAYGMLLRRNDKKLSVFSNRRAPPLTPLQNTSARCISGSHIRASACTVLANKFKRRGRYTNADGHPSNLASENLTKRQRPGWTSTHDDCSSHRIALGYKWTFKRLSKCVKGMGRWEDCLQMGPDFCLWQKCVFTVIFERLRLKEGVAPERAREYAKHMVLMFANENDVTDCTVRLMLAVLPNGDWENWTEVEYYVPCLASVVNQPALIYNVASGLSAALTPCVPQKHREDHWTGAERATSQAGIGVACHGIFTTPSGSSLCVRVEMCQSQTRMLVGWTCCVTTKATQ